MEMMDMEKNRSTGSFSGLCLAGLSAIRKFQKHPNKKRESLWTFPSPKYNSHQYQ
jgi:hypothetical protein